MAPTKKRAQSNRITIGLAAFSIAIAFGLPSAEAQIIFNSTSYVSTTQEFISKSSSVNGTTSTRAFGTATPASGYTGPAFSAGYEVTASASVTGLNFNRQRVENNTGVTFGGNDFLNIAAFGSSVPASTTFSMAGVVFFSSGSPFEMTSLSLTSTASVRSASTAQTGRYMVQVGGSYYLSQQTFTLATSGNGTVSSYNFSGNLTWAAYDPASAINFNQGSAIFNALSLSSVEGAGIYLENDSFVSPASVQTNYTVSALNLGQFHAVPEPGTFVSLLGGLGLLVLFRRWRRN